MMNNSFNNIMEQKYQNIMKFEIEMFDLEKVKEKQFQNLIERLEKSYQTAKNDYKRALQENDNQLFANAQTDNERNENFRLHIATKADHIALAKMKKLKKKIFFGTSYNIPHLITDFNKINRMQNNMKSDIQSNITIIKSTNDEIKQLQRKIDHLKPEEIQLDSAIAAVQNSINSFEKSKTDEINIIEEEMDTIEKQITEINSRLEILKQKKISKESENDDMLPLMKIKVAN